MALHRRVSAPASPRYAWPLYGSRPTASSSTWTASRPPWLRKRAPQSQKTCLASAVVRNGRTLMNVSMLLRKMWRTASNAKASLLTIFFASYASRMNDILSRVAAAGDAWARDPGHPGQVEGTSPDQCRGKRRRLSSKTPAPIGDLPTNRWKQAASNLSWPQVVAGPWASGAPRPLGHRRRRRGRGEQRQAPQLLQLRYANTSSFSAEAERHFLCSGADAWLLAESHLRGQPLTYSMEKCRRAGWSVFGSPAERSASSAKGTYGGVMAASLQHHAFMPIASAAPRQHGFIDQDWNLTGFSARLRGWSLLVLVGYARHGLVDRLLRGVHGLTQGGKLPFLLFADFNRSPAYVQALPAIELRKARVTVAKGAEMTCDQGEGTRIYFCVHSDGLRCLLDLTSNIAVPWEPHRELIAPLHRRADTVRVPRVIPSRDPNLIQGLRRGSAQHLSWDEAIDFARTLSSRSLASSSNIYVQRRAAARLGLLPEALALGERFRELIVAAQAQQFRGQGFAHDEVALLPATIWPRDLAIACDPLLRPHAAGH